MQGDVAVFKEFNLKSHYQARHAANYDKLGMNSAKNESNWEVF